MRCVFFAQDLALVKSIFPDAIVVLDMHHLQARVFEGTPAVLPWVRTGSFNIMYGVINTESLHHVQQIVILLDTLGVNITTTSLSQFSCFLPSRLVDGVAKPPLFQTSGMVMMGDGLKKKLDSTTIKVLAGLVQDFMVSVYTLNSLCVV